MRQSIREIGYDPGNPSAGQLAEPRWIRAFIASTAAWSAPWSKPCRETGALARRGEVPGSRSSGLASLLGREPADVRLPPILGELELVKREDVETGHIGGRRHAPAPTRSVAACRRRSTRTRRAGSLR